MQRVSADRRNPWLGYESAEWGGWDAEWAIEIGLAGSARSAWKNSRFFHWS